MMTYWSDTIATKNKQIAFTCFYQSYRYKEFIEEIKLTLDDEHEDYYSKIQMVLGDNAKEDFLEFIIDRVIVSFMNNGKR